MNKIYKFFGNDSLFGRIFGTLGNIIVVNFFFILCSIPIITFGAAFTSMYYTLLRSLKYGDTSLTRDFFRSFRENFRQSTLSRIISVVFIIIFSADIGMFGPNGVYPVTAVYYLIIVLAVIVTITAMFVFPVIAAFRNTLKKLWIQSFFNYILGNSDPNITVSDIANYLHISRSYLFTLFKEHLNTSPQRFLAMSRIRNACELLTNTDLPVTTIASSCGYQNPFAFSRAFKKEMEIAPSEYRQKYNNVRK